MKVYRIAHESDAENGPYMGEVCLPLGHRLCNATPSRPWPLFVESDHFAHADGFESEILASMLYGFKTLSSLRAWFGKKGLAELDGLGFCLYTIEVPWVVLSEKQLVMPKAHIEILNQKPLSEI